VFPPIAWSLQNRAHALRSMTNAWLTLKVTDTFFSHPKVTRFGGLPFGPELRVEAIRFVCFATARERFASQVRYRT
jgi:hypothetical protein